ncbi:DUF5689 domain-containing protein [Aquimarina hainanensis]|uniref:DUF5689 domain-containing protein n=1 Tax=Aquimarina hainanensis TaxID=1578017 RepID=A0ABW5N0T9_9FLAO
MMKLKLLVMSLFISLLMSNYKAYTQEVFINEIHYDNTSTDVQEAIEIAGPAGTDLSGWKILLYNGSNGTVYNTITLTETITDQQNGYGTQVQIVPTNGLQNGAPDGIALVDNTDQVIQFLSYEGVMTATDGAASGMSSTDIGVSESSSTQVGFSLQLSGTGAVATDFSWQQPQEHTYGAINTAQQFIAPITTPRINEFVCNHTGSDTDEFVEVLGLPATDLSNYWLLEIEGDSNAAGTIDEVIQLGMTDVQGYYTTAFGSNTFENGTLALLLVKNFTGAMGTDLDTNDDGVLDITPWEAIVDDIGVNDGGTTDINYASVSLLKSYDGISFTVGGASRIPNGIDTNTVADWVRNDFDGEGLPSFPTAEATNGEALNTPGKENKVVTGSDEALVFINEVDADTEGTDTREFIELFDGGVGNTSLDGYVMVLYNGSNDESYQVYNLQGYTTSATGYFVIGNAAVPGVGLEIPNNTLQNGADAVALYKTTTPVSNGAAITTEDLVDAVVYDTNDADDIALLVLLNEGQPQLNEDDKGNKNQHSVQRFPNGTGGTRNTNTYTQAIATPGTANTNATEVISLVINELDADTEGTDTKEFVELYDGGAGNTSLDGFVLVAYNGNTDLSYQAFDLDGYSTDAAGYFVIGNEGVSNVDVIIPSNSLQNGADAIALYRGEATGFPTGSEITTNQLIDAVVYDTDDSDDTALLLLLNEGQPQLNENENGKKDQESLQRIPNGAGGARNTIAFVLQTPTPGVDNDAIVLPGELISIAEARAATVGSVVKITGILTATDQFRGPAFIQDTTGGIAVFDEQLYASETLKIGDSITVTATRAVFNDQIQLGTVTEVISHGRAQEEITPKEITLATLEAHAGQLVKIVNPTFPNPGDLLFGNANYTLTDTSSTGALRIDNDVATIVGLAQPSFCTEVIGIVGRFREFYQLLPRQKTDIPCAETYIPPGDTIGIPKESTFDVVTWNIEWFGDENNSPVGTNPLSDQIQRDSTALVFRKLQADVYAVQEIADEVLLGELVSQLPGYDYVLSDAVSYPSSPDVKQKVGFVYNTETVSVVETKALLRTIHPLYNGGDSSAISDYPGDPTRFYASGRLPFLMTADVTVDGVTERIDLIALHARANRSTDAQNRYDMRKYDVEILKDTLDTYYADRNVLLLGDYNDDVDETVADISSPLSSFDAYVKDTTNYTIVSAALSEAGLRSYVFRENMIDHIMMTNELVDAYVDTSVSVHYEVYDNDYARNTSDHLPVSARFLLEPAIVDNDCLGGNIAAFKQGRRKDGRRVPRYRSNPKKALGKPRENRYFNFVSLGFGGEITIELTNEIYDNKDANEFAVYESTGFFGNVPCQYFPEKAEVFASVDGEHFVSLGTTCQDGEFDLAAGKLRSAKFIKVVDISDKSLFPWFADGYDLDAIACLDTVPAKSKAAPMTQTKSESLFASELLTEEIALEETNVTMAPNPVQHQLTLSFKTITQATVMVVISDLTGKVIYSKEEVLTKGTTKVQLDTQAYATGTYIVSVVDDKNIFSYKEKLIKR